jgi:hypothetical protein
MDDKTQDAYIRFIRWPVGETESAAKDIGHAFVGSFADAENAFDYLPRDFRQAGYYAELRGHTDLVWGFKPVSEATVQAALGLESVK